MATTQDYINQLKVDKQNLVSMLNNMGVEASDSETFTSLTPKVGKIVTDPILQDKSVEITENGTTNIVADEGYDGLNNVEVTTNISGGEEPEIGLITKKYNSEGYPLEVLSKGMTFSKGLKYLFAVVSSSYPAPAMIYRLEKLTFKNAIFSNSLVPQYFCFKAPYLKEVVFDNCTGLITIDSFAFDGCSQLTTINIPNTVTKINQDAFMECSKLILNTIPDSVTTLGNGAFRNCTSLKQISMKNVNDLGGSITTMGRFWKCTSLKAAWIGSAPARIDEFVFQACSSLSKIFIDLPRATVETFGGYSYKFMYNSSATVKIICNDDEGFITKEEFDSIDWSTAV